jgi:hypothetical protein
VIPTVFLHAPDAAQTLTLQELQRWKLRPVLPRLIDGFSHRQDAPYAMALSEV